MRENYSFMLKKVLQMCNWKLKKNANCFRIAVCIGCVPYGPFMKALFYVLQNLHARNHSMPNHSFFAFATREQLQTARFLSGGIDFFVIHVFCVRSSGYF